MKVYVIIYDNGESWEDNFREIEKIFLDKEKAFKYLNDNYICELSKFKLMESSSFKQLPYFWYSQDENSFEFREIQEWDMVV